MSDRDLHASEAGRIIVRLKAAGWDMADGAETLGLASMTYHNGRMLIELEQDYEQRELLFTLESPDGRGTTVYPVYGDSLEATLDAVIGFQDRVGPENFQEILKELVVACSEVYVQEGDDSEARLLTAE
ncbi:hypothetical protein [Streptomyces sp. NBC_01508]|uniref:hypothetical protein n=1 Tax=Streptomyces sp. NBC_01508 TaxID=2903888 RepID=UPI00386BADF3